MKLATCTFKGQQCLAIIDAQWDMAMAGRALCLDQQDLWPPQVQSMQALIEFGDKIHPLLQQIVAQADAAEWMDLSALRLMAPIPTPRRNIICLGWNYAEHAKESSAAKDIKIQDLPKHPIVFTKATTTANGPFDAVPHNPRVSRRLDWEVELGVIIGKQGRFIDTGKALDYVFGYTVVNDISARDLQKRHQQFFMGKSVDGTCPMGPWIVTRDEIQNPQNLNLRCKVNTVTKQDANTGQMIFDIATTISTLSNAMTLLPGDIIATGTPSGVGFARNPPEYLQAGDVVECEVESVGIIKNAIAAHS